MIRRISILVLFAVLVGCGGTQEIVGDIGEKEANEIVVLLASNGISAQKVAKKATGAGAAGSTATFAITVPASRVTDSLAILNQHGLPRRPGPSLLSLFTGSGLVKSAQEEQIRYQEGLAEQIAGTIRKIDGVVDAVVQISFPSTEQAVGPADAEKQEVRAAVYVKHTGVLDDPNSQLVVKIKRLVSASAVGLTYDNVTVISDRARYSDLSLEEQIAILPEEEREYTSVWGIVIAKGSVGSFQTIFILLSLIILLLAGFVAWVLWKLFPALQQAGGVGQLFTNVKPIYPGGEAPEKKKKGEEEEELHEEGEE